jgi:DNA-binding transcriptional LysR family regulator
LLDQIFLGRIVDRIDAMKVFVATLDAGSFARAGRKLGRSPAAVSRAIAFLEAHVGSQLLHRTTRSVRASETGERYAIACRRILSDLEEADTTAAIGRSTPRGTITLTADVYSGEAVLRPILDAFMDVYPAVCPRLHLLDRVANLIEEGVDIALRIAHLPDSALVAVRVGEVRRVVVAAPDYLARHPRIEKTSDLTKHPIIAMPHFGIDSWSFPPAPGSSVPRTVRFAPRLVINSIRGGVSAAVGGRGVTRLFSHQVADELREGKLEIVLEGEEYPPLPVHLVSPRGRLSVPKVRAFMDFAMPRLREHFAGLAKESRDVITLARSQHGVLARESSSLSLSR